MSNDPVNRWDLVGLYSIFGLEFSDGGGVGGFFKDLGGYAGAAGIGAGQGLYGATVGAAIETYNEGSAHMEVGFQAIADGDYVEGTLNVVAAVGKVGELALEVAPGGKAATEALDKGSDLLGASKAIQRSASEPVADATKRVGDLPSPGRGPGSVPPNERDSQRLFTKDQKAEKLEQAGGKCEGCSDNISLDEAKGHHVERHADGGATTNDNLAVLCDDCHKEIHK